MRLVWIENLNHVMQLDGETKLKKEKEITWRAEALRYVSIWARAGMM